MDHIFEGEDAVRMRALIDAIIAEAEPPTYRCWECGGSFPFEGKKFTGPVYHVEFRHYCEPCLRVVHERAAWRKQARNLFNEIGGIAQEILFARAVLDYKG